MNKTSVKRTFRLFLPVFIFCVSVVPAFAATNKYLPITLTSLNFLLYSVYSNVIALFPVMFFLTTTFIFVHGAAKFFMKAKDGL